MPSVDEICWKFLQAFKQGIQDLVLQKPQNLIWALERSYAAAQHSNKNYSCTNKAQSMSAQIDQPWLSLYFKLLFRDKQLLLLLRKLLLLVQRKAGRTQGTICSALILGRLSGFELYDNRTAKIHLIKLYLNIWKGYFVHRNSFVLSRGLQSTASDSNLAREAITSGAQRHYVNNEEIPYLRKICRSGKDVTYAETMTLRKTVTWMAVSWVLLHSRLA